MWVLDMFSRGEGKKRGWRGVEVIHAKDKERLTVGGNL